MGEGVFAYCRNLKSIKVESDNRVYDSRNNCNAIIETNSNTLVAGCASTTFPSPNVIKCIGKSAFYGIQIDNLDIPYGVETIEDAAFMGCSSNSVNIPSTVSSIGMRAFYWCDIQSIDLSKTQITELKKETFAHSNLTSLEFPNSLKSIGDSAFYFVDELTNITLPNSLSSIGAYAFKYCEGLTSIKIPEGVEIIEKEAFKGCHGAITIILPTTIKSLEMRAFDYCKNVTSVYYLSEKPCDDISSLAFDLTANNAVLYVPKGAVDNYKFFANYHSFKSLQEINGTLSLTVDNNNKIVSKGSVVKLSSNVEDARIYYTLDGSVPHRGSESYLPTGIVLIENCILKAIAYKAGYIESEVLTVSYSVKEKLVVSTFPSPGEVMINSIVSLSANNPKAKIHYTVDGTTPTSSSTLFDPNTTRIVVDKNLTIKAVAFEDDSDESEVLTVNYTTGGYPYDGIAFVGKTEEGASMVFQVISANNKTCQVGISDYPGNLSNPCVAQNYSGKITIPKKVEDFDVVGISSCAFAMCDGINSVTIPESISYIYWGAFVSCKQLQNVYSFVRIPFEIDDYAFCSDWDGTWITGTLYVPFATKEKYQLTAGWKNFKNIVEMAPPTTQVSISRAGYATFYDSQSTYTLPNGLKALVVSGTSNNKLTYQTLSNSVVPAGTAVMLASDNKQSGTYTLTATESDVSYTGTNLLRGSDEAQMTTGDGYHYKLSYGKSGTTWSNVFGWYWGADDGGSFMTEGHKAWLVVPKSVATTRGYSVDGETTGISTLELSEDAAVYYDLQGRRITQPTTKGVYIKNGKKVMVK